MFYSNVNKIFLGTDGAASSRVSKMLPLRVDGSIPYSAPLMTINYDSSYETQIFLNYEAYTLVIRP